MKIRSNFVTNSSSSSFVVSRYDNVPRTFNYFKDIKYKTIEALAKKLCISEKDFIRQYGNMSDISKWNIEITEDGIICSTYLDNLDLKALALDLGLVIEVEDNYED